MAEIDDLLQQILAFRDERNWKQFHTPRNLAAAIGIEVGELQETMLWKTNAAVEQFLGTPEGKTSISAEIADVLIYCFLLCNAVGIDPVLAIREKLAENNRKYPVELARDTAAKYTKLK